MSGTISLFSRLYSSGNVITGGAMVSYLRRLIRLVFHQIHNLSIIIYPNFSFEFFNRNRGSFIIPYF